MARTTLQHILFGLAATGLLTACVEGAGTGAGDASATTAPAKVRVGQEVEAPDVFQANESALWDGRPSLGGTWVASPDAVDPERVVMFNPATGKSVTGALFRRERENPGPRLQLSSDAADALGVLAGQPTEIEVTALRKQEAAEEVVPAVPAALEGDAAESAIAGSEAAGTEGAAATAAAAVAALDAAGTGAAEAGADPAAVAAEPAPLTWKERRAKAKAEREARKAAAAAAKAEAAAAETGAAALGADAVAATVDSADVAEIDTAPLDAPAPDIGSDATPDPAPASPKTTERAADSVKTAPAPSGAVRSIQIASFSKEENATRAVQALAKIGITARIQKSDTGGKLVWGVVASGDAAMLQSIKDAGFADAYFLK